MGFATARTYSLRRTAHPMRYLCWVNEIALVSPAWLDSLLDSEAFRAGVRSAGWLALGLLAIRIALRLRSHSVVRFTELNDSEGDLAPALLRSPERTAAALVCGQWLGWFGGGILLAMALSPWLPLSNLLLWGLPIALVAVPWLDSRAAQGRARQSVEGRAWLRLFMPILLAPTVALSGVYRRLMAAPTADQRAAELEDLAQTIDETSEEESPEEEKTLLKSLITINQKPVRDVMCERANMRTLTATDTFAQVQAHIRSYGYSRYPVMDAAGLTVRGILVAKDLLHIQEQYARDQVKPDWRKLLRTPYYVPATRRVPQLLNEFKARRLHLAIVLNEHGQVAGLVTLQDVLDEIFGEMTDEFDAPAPQQHK
jgi:CBS domain containing-hemolysin-like protein